MTTDGPPSDSRGVPAEEWTDEEWMAVIRTIPPFAPKEVGEWAVAEMRGRRDAE
jgi:hypothetical protein